MSESFRQFIDSAALVERASRLIATPTTNPPGNESALAESLADELRQLGIETTIVPLGPGRSSVVGRLRGRGNRPALVLSGHLDTVPPGHVGWTRDPFAPTVVNGRLYGLGSADMKGAVAAMVEAAAALRRSEAVLQGDLLLAFTADEETNSTGAATLVESGTLAGAGAIIIGEPTANEVFIAEKGVAWIEMTTRGHTAHGSMPERGVNAIYHMAAVLGEFSNSASTSRHIRCWVPRRSMSVPSLAGSRRMSCRTAAWRWWICACSPARLPMTRSARSRISFRACAASSRALKPTSASSRSARQLTPIRRHRSSDWCCGLPRR